MLTQFELVQWPKACNANLYRVIEVGGKRSLIRAECSNPFYNGMHYRVDNAELVNIVLEA